MRKVKKINGYLVVRFNEREKQGYPQLGSVGVIDAELYTGCIDTDLGAMEYEDADTLEAAVEQARGLESEQDYSGDPPVCTLIVEAADETTEEEVDPQLMIAGFENSLQEQAAHGCRDVDARTAAHELRLQGRTSGPGPAGTGGGAGAHLRPRVPGAPALYLRKALRERVSELKEMYTENHAVRKYRGACAGGGAL